METSDLDTIFVQLEKLLKRHKTGLTLKTGFLSSSNAKDTSKPSLHLYGRKNVSIGGRKPQQTYVCGIIQQKHFVGLYVMPLYSHPAKIKIDNPRVAKMRKGKSCINVNKLDPEILKTLESIIASGITIYKKEKWI